MATNANERRCSAKTKRGRCRVTRGLNADGLCPMHAGTTDPRELGRRSAKARRRPKPERVHESLRDYLRREVPPERVWRALEAAMLGNNESARVAASRVLMDALHEPERDNEYDRKVATAEAAERFAQLIEQRARAHKRLQVRDALDELAEELSKEAIDEHPDLTVVGDVSASRAAAILQGLEEQGLLVRASKLKQVERERDEALSRLQEFVAA